jgi:hypothetical protein
LAGQKLTDDETEILRSIGQQNVQPWLEWATKQEQEAKKSFTVDDVVLHIHETWIQVASATSLVGEISSIKHRGTV